MNIEDLQTICRKLKGVTEDIKWEDHLCFNVGNKMFLVTAPDQIPHTASFKVSDEEFDTLCAKEGFTAAPYLARYKWVQLNDINRLSKKEWEYYIKQSYSRIASKLPGKIKKELGIMKPLI
jgi:predicted DNA-binding protein (MmcQ/YjbR family)